MIERIIAIYCICDDFFKNQGVEHWPNIKMTDAELMTAFIVAHMDFYGNIDKARIFLQEHGYIPSMLGKSRFCRRLHQFNESIWQELISYAGTKGSLFGLPNEFIVDSFPLRVCQNIRMNRARLFPEVQCLQKRVLSRDKKPRISDNVWATVDCLDVSWQSS